VHEKSAIFNISNAAKIEMTSMYQAKRN